MASWQKIIVVGHLGKDPVLKDVGQDKVCNFSVAVSEKWNKGGEPQEHTEWFDVAVWGKSAEACSKYLHKGSKALVEGTLRSRAWVSNAGKAGYSLEIRAFGVQFLDSKDSSDKPAAQQEAAPQDDDSVPF
jgi:single-strand DNA-binding protein